MTTLRTFAEAGPQFRKTQDAMRWWARQPSFPLQVVRIGRRMFVTQESIDKFFADTLQEAS